MKNCSYSTRKPVALDRKSRYLTPTGRVCRLVAMGPFEPGRAQEATFAYERPASGSGPRELGERITMQVAFARRTLVRVG